jgi:hypothetical protein
MLNQVGVERQHHAVSTNTPPQYKRRYWC